MQKVLRQPGWLIAVLLICVGAYAADQHKVLRAAKVRSGPGVYYPIVEKLDKDSQLQVMEKGDRWVKVKTKAGKQGWVSRKAFDKPLPPRGYGKVLSEAGLEGASTTVETMAARGLGSTGAGGAMDNMVMEFLQGAPFRPEGFGDFLDELKPCSCGKLLAKKGIPRPAESDPQNDELERRLGLFLVSRILAEKKLITDATVDDYVNKVGMAVALHSSRYDLSWRFVVFEGTKPKVLAIPGGFVMVSDGLLKQLQDESELAGVLGTAIAHILLDHGAQELKSAMKGKQKPEQLIAEAHRLLHKDRPLKQLIAADALGTVLSACAGYDPTALTRVIQRTDPKAKLRTARLLKLIKSARLKGGKKLKTRFEKLASL
jgi:hypothetical protein